MVDTLEQRSPHPENVRKRTASQVGASAPSTAPERFQAQWVGVEIKNAVAGSAC